MAKQLRRLDDVGKTTWSMRLTAVVKAEPELVMAWWFHPDRKDDFRHRIERDGATDVSLTESTADGVRVRTATFRDRRGWTHDHQVETRLTAEGMGTRRGDRFIAPTGDVNNLHSPRGQRITLQCAGGIEFVPQSEGPPRSPSCIVIPSWGERGVRGGPFGAPTRKRKIASSMN
jgi:hypothetical protein